MTEDSTIPKARKKPEYDPWLILMDKPQDVLSDFDSVTSKTYDSLAACDAACRKLAVANVGVTFTPVKYGKPSKAGKVEKVALL